MTRLDFAKAPDGLVPAVAQDWRSGRVLMLAYMNQEAWERTCASRVATYWSRSRRRLWTKGERSGNIQRVKEILVDCDLDAVLLRVEQVGGAACHTGRESCFHRRLEPDGSLKVLGTRIFDPSKTYGEETPGHPSDREDREKSPFSSPAGLQTGPEHV